MSELVKKIKTKIEDKKLEKEIKLLDSAYRLYLTKGINNTSIQDIVNEAGVAKGTFYLYFKDKYDIQEVLTIKKSNELFHKALDSLNTDVINKFDDQLIFVIDFVIDELKKNPDLVKFIYKDLSFGFYNQGINTIFENGEIGIYETFMHGLKTNNLKLKNPEVTLYMIIELTSSTIFNSIIKSMPLPIDEYKPYLYKTIRNILNESK